jgi:predicted transcriptional regulator
VTENKPLLYIGVATQEEVRARAIAIARGEYKPSANEPKVWFTSLNSLAQVLCDENKLLLNLIQEKSPQSLQELAEMSGREKSNLSRTLRTMERYKLVTLKEENGRLIPVAPYSGVKVILDWKRQPQFARAA